LTKAPGTLQSYNLDATAKKKALLELAVASAKEKVKRKPAAKWQHF
jgi:hypothetical protein